MLGYPKSADILVRLLAVTFLVGATYNPGGHCYVRWLLTGSDPRWMLKVFAGLLLFTGLLMCVRATLRSLNIFGLVPLLLLIGSLIWLLSSWRLIDLSDPLQRALTVEASIALVLGIGVCFSIIRYHLSGQLDSRNLS